MKTKPFLGIKSGCVREIFRHEATPTQAEFGKRFLAVVGPFRTIRGAKFMRDHGWANPHCLCVADAERLAVELAEKKKGEWKWGSRH